MACLIRKPLIVVLTDSVEEQFKKYSEKVYRLVISANDAFTNATFFLFLVLWLVIYI